VALTAIIVLGAFLRFYLLYSGMHFDVDEANHVKSVYGIWTNHQLLTQGPPTSSGLGLYHGAYYYYLLLIPAVIGEGNPLAVVTFCALLSTLAVFFIGSAVMKQYGKLPGILAALLMAASFDLVQYGRWIWNPNLIPFFMALSLFALVKTSPKRPKYLILFSFALSSITQLHLGGFVFVPIYLLLIPFLIRVVKNKRIWAISILAFIIPWTPTIYYETTHNFEMFRGIISLLSAQSNISFWQHLTTGYNYMLFMFDRTLHLPEITRSIFIYSGIAALLLQLKNWRHAESVLLPIYLLISLIFTFLIVSFYPDYLYVHLAEQLFVIYIVLVVFILQILFMHNETIIVSLLILGFFLQQNLTLFQDKIVNGSHQYEIIDKACRSLKDQHLDNVEMMVNNQKNPVYLTYVCLNQYGVHTGSKFTLTLSPDQAKGLGRPIEQYMFNNKVIDPSIKN
jgi:hypothetical protein